MIKAVFFDKGGVLTHTTGPNSRILFARALHVSSRELAPVFYPLLNQVAEGHISEVEFCLALGKKFGLPPDRARRLVQIFRKRRFHNKPMVRAVARRLKESGYVVGILSDAIPVHVRMNRKIGAYRGFSPVLLSCEIGATKRRPAAFRIAARRAKVKFSEMIFLDDHEKKVAIAKKLGIRAFVYKNPAQLVRQLRRFGVNI